MVEFFAILILIFICAGAIAMIIAGLAMAALAVYAAVVGIINLIR